MAIKKQSKVTPLIPGMESFVQDKEEEWFFENEKKESYFDAMTLPDVPSRQANANGAQTFVGYLLFPSQEELLRAITALSGGKRKQIAASTVKASINAIVDMGNGQTFLEFWEEKCLGKKTKKKELDPDEAHAPGVE